MPGRKHSQGGGNLSFQRKEFDFSDFYCESDHVYDQALHEIKTGGKVSHWIWYILPQLSLHGHSTIALYFGIHSLAEAKSFLADEKLGSRLLEISSHILSQLQGGVNIYKLMGSQIDAIKLLSCATLFYYASEASEHNELFRELMAECSKRLSSTDAKTIEFCTNSEAASLQSEI